MDTNVIAPKLAGKRVSPGEQMHRLMTRLFPFCRSVTGNGVRETLHLLQEYIPLVLHEVPTGTEVFDWTIPDEWNISDAWIRDPQGKKIVDFRENNLHVLNYSIPVHKKVSLQELKKHLYTLPQYPEWIPYRTSYYERNWGFCMAHTLFEKLKEGEYEVFVDSSLRKGSLTYGEFYLKGNSPQEILISTHICHPSMCNDNLSGICVTAFLAKQLMEQKDPLRYSYRFLFAPATIGAIAWLKFNESNTPLIKHGLVASLLGDPGDFTYKRTRQGDAEIDRVVTHYLSNNFGVYHVVDFHPYGDDERQFSSPGFNLPVGRLSRTPFAQFPQYHSSGDNLDFVKPEMLEESLSVYAGIQNMLERNKTYRNLQPKGEPQLGRRGLYAHINNTLQPDDIQMALLWILNLSDGQHTLLDISERSGLGFDLITDAANMLVKHNLLTEI